MLYAEPNYIVYADAVPSDPRFPELWGLRNLGQTIAGVIDVLDTTVTMEIELPGLLGMIAGGLKDRLQKAGTLLLTRK